MTGKYARMKDTQIFHSVMDSRNLTQRSSGRAEKRDWILYIL